MSNGRARDDKAADGTDLVRLQKVLALAGIGSRRACEALIDEGRVEVDGKTVTEQGMRVDPRTAVVRVDGERVPTAPDTAVYAFNKPKGVVSTMSDEQGRPCVGDYVRGRTERLFHVGRLDIDTEGLLILTNDGELANRLGPPVPRDRQDVRGDGARPGVPAELRVLRGGVELEDGLARSTPPASCRSCPIAR